MDSCTGRSQDSTKSSRLTRCLSSGCTPRRARDTSLRFAQLSSTSFAVQMIGPRRAGSSPTYGRRPDLELHLAGGLLDDLAETLQAWVRPQVQLPGEEILPAQGQVA